MQKIDGISFIIAAMGNRDDFVKSTIIPSIRRQNISHFEIILVGKYRYRPESPIRLIPFRKKTDLFYKPFQLGVDSARFGWIVDLDDDMVLADEWYANLCQHGDHEAFDLSGFMILYPDGTQYGGYFDAYDGKKNGTFAGETTYFSSYIAKKKLFEICRYPTYQSGDRAHVIKLAKIHKVPLRKRLLDDVHVIHAGFHRKSKPFVLKRSANYARGRQIRKIAMENGVSWIGLADRYMNFNEKTRYRTIKKILRRMDEFEIRELKQKESWLW